jgi:hypothetical protein
MVRCLDATASSLVAEDRSEVFAHFQAVIVKRYSSKQNWLFGHPGFILCEQSPWCQIKWWACFWLRSSPFSSFSVSDILGFPRTAHAFFPEHLFKHCQSLRRTFSESYTKFDAVPLSVPSRNGIRQDTRLQIKLRKNHDIHPTAWNFVHKLLRYASTTIYCCIALLQTLCKWQRQSRKLWIAKQLHRDFWIATNTQWQAKTVKIPPVLAG